ncbi:hypothetical protein Syun_026858 [Stephania yunnanensis]|uniref:Bifunctional inhibitor/plant lipid transfer protein/seed storage helical domain-containing protein n=1 Tax=Stephania yunnanensis TaxID=152371 RepID=A0AAP0HPD8_9MAGN
MAKYTSVSMNLVFLMVMLVVVVGIGGANGVAICGMESSELAQCLPAVRPPGAPPTPGCCGVMHHADLHCLCTFKAVLPGLGIDPALAMALPKKCGIAAPPECGGAW